ncbi:hypothetical protein GC173_13770 [bacterium]|nr:hypothetical protein [bacterium]
MSSFHVLDKSYVATPEGGIAANVVVVRDPDYARGCTLPSAANQGAVLGITTHSQARQGRSIAVRRLGVAEVIAAGAINVGDRVVVADNQGRVSAAPLPRFSIGSVGANNAVVLEWLVPSDFNPAMTITVENQGGDDAFSWAFENGGIVLRPATTSEAISQTAASLLAAINGDATLSAFLRASHATGSSGAGLVGTESVACSNPKARLNSFGIAEGSATEAGDRIPVLLTP